MTPEEKLEEIVNTINKNANFVERYGGSGTMSKHPDFNVKGTETGRRRWFEKRRKELRKTVAKKPRFFGRLREPGRFFSPERIKKRHDFRIKVSGNRKWIMIGVAIVAVCGTIVYLSVTYGGIFK